MPFISIDPTTPAGNEKIKFGDDRIREFKSQTIDNFKEVSNYPAATKPALRTAVWTTAQRPSGAELVDRVSGYNTDDARWEYYDIATTSWKPMNSPSGYGVGETTLSTVTGDLNNITRGGRYFVTDTAPNRPEDWGVLDVFPVSSVDSYQTWHGTASGKVFTRKKSQSTWGAWKQLATTDGSIATANGLADGVIGTKFAMLSGVIGHGQQIPLPEGYTQAQCKWMVSPNYTDPHCEWNNNYLIATYCSADANRWVTAYVQVSAGNRPGNANYIIIGIK